MKKMRIAAGVMCTVMLMSGAAFAAETETNNSLLTAVPISAQAGTENVKTAEYAVESGVITDVAESNGYMRVTLGTAPEGIVLILKEDVKIVNTATGSMIKQSELKKDMHIFALIDANSPTTMSLPPQTAGTVGIIVADSNAVLAFDAYYEQFTGKTIVQDEADDTYVELRTLAEEKGYTVTWTSNKKPIILTKDDITAEITIGSDEFTYTHMTRDIQPLDRMEKLSLSVKLENGKTMVPKSFVDALK